DGGGDVAVDHRRLGTGDVEPERKAGDVEAAAGDACTGLAVGRPQCGNAGTHLAGGPEPAAGPAADDDEDDDDQDDELSHGGSGAARLRGREPIATNGTTT